jgi:uncharacterized protein
VEYLDPSLNGSVGQWDAQPTVLCLSGGGYRGLYTACILEHLQTLTVRPLRKHFTFIAGTSIGALIGAALAADISPTRIREHIERLGPRLFKRRLFHGVRRYFRAPYSQKVLSNALTELFSQTKPHDLLDRPLHEQPLAIVILATSISAHEPRIYGGRRLPDCDPHITLRQALLASSAAPTYFPVQVIRNELLADGGLVANAPDAIALGLLQKRFGADRSDCRMLSIGTCAPSPSHQPAAPTAPGRLGWVLRKPNIVDVTLEAQERLTIRAMHEILGERFVRIDSQPSGKDYAAVSTLDHVAPKTTAVLKDLARTEFERVRTVTQVTRFFS